MEPPPGPASSLKVLWESIQKSQWLSDWGDGREQKESLHPLGAMAVRQGRCRVTCMDLTDGDQGSLVMSSEAHGALWRAGGCQGQWQEDYRYQWDSQSGGLFSFLHAMALGTLPRSSLPQCQGLGDEFVWVILYLYVCNLVFHFRTFWKLQHLRVPLPYLIAHLA